MSRETKKEWTDMDRNQSAKGSDAVSIATSISTSLASSGAEVRRPPTAYRALGTTWFFRLLHVAGLLLTLPVVIMTRLRPSSGHERHDESIFVETNRMVLTALGIAFMA